MERENIGPGPGKYLLPSSIGYGSHDFTRHRSPQFSMGLKLGSLKKEFGPGPKYLVENLTRYGKASPPAYSIKFRQKPLAAFQLPGPRTTYTPEKELKPPSCNQLTDVEQPLNPEPDEYKVPSTMALPLYKFSLIVCMIFILVLLLFTIDVSNLLTFIMAFNFLRALIMETTILGPMSWLIEDVRSENESSLSQSGRESSLKKVFVISRHFF